MTALFVSWSGATDLSDNVTERASDDQRLSSLDDTVLVVVAPQSKKVIRRRLELRVGNS